MVLTEKDSRWELKYSTPNMILPPVFYSCTFPTQARLRRKTAWGLATKANFLVNYISLISIILGSDNVIVLTGFYNGVQLRAKTSYGLKMYPSAIRRQNDSYILSVLFFMYQKTSVIFFFS